MTIIYRQRFPGCVHKKLFLWRAELFRIALQKCKTLKLTFTYDTIVLKIIHLQDEVL